MDNLNMDEGSLDLEEGDLYQDEGNMNLEKGYPNSLSYQKCSKPLLLIFTNGSLDVKCAVKPIT